jgi:hypothetical protein
MVMPTDMPDSIASMPASTNGEAPLSASSASSDPLAAFLDGLHGLSSPAIESAPPAGASPPILLSNGLNADAGVAQLISALASLHDGNAGFNAMPFATSSETGLAAVIAPAPSST